MTYEPSIRRVIQLTFIFKCFLCGADELVWCLKNRSSAKTDENFQLLILKLKIWNSIGSRTTIITTFFLHYINDSGLVQTRSDRSLTF